MCIVNKDFSKYPKFRHNLWTQHENINGSYYLTFSKGLYEVDKADAESFIQIRSHCTGYNSLQQISIKSGFTLERISEIVTSLKEIDLLHLPITDLNLLDDAQKTETLLDACRIWREQIAETHLLNKILQGSVSKTVVQGWLLETYHYIKIFPESILNGFNNCAYEELKLVLYKYYLEEIGHEKFIERTLLKAGLSSEEVKNSIPLVSTRLIDFLLKELFSLCPPAVLLVASIIEAAEVDVGKKETLIQSLNDNYNFSLDVMDPYFTHVNIDINLGHEQLLTNHIETIRLIPTEMLHDITNKIHDIKHAFDLQQLEIEHYYGKVGNYFPRQFVDFYAI